MLSVGSWATDTHNATSRIRRRTTAEAPGSLSTLDVEDHRKSSVKSAKPDLLSFRPKSSSPAKETYLKAAPCGEGMNKSVARKASVATSLKAVEEANEEQGKSGRTGNIAIVVTPADDKEVEEDKVSGDRD